MNNKTSEKKKKLKKQRGKNSYGGVSLLLRLHVNDPMRVNCTAFPVISTLVFPEKHSISLSQSDIRLFKGINSSDGESQRGSM